MDEPLKAYELPNYLPMIKKLFLSCVFFVCMLALHAQQTKEEIQKKQQDLQRELASLNNTLAEIKKNKKQSLGQLALVQRKINARQELINNINHDLRRLDDEIYKNQIDIYRYKKELDTLKQQYAQSIVFAYKNRSNYDYLNFLFSAASFNDAIKRVAYLKSYRLYRETQADNIVKTQDLLKEKIGTLTSNKTEKSSTLQEQNKQLNVLEDDKKEKDQVVKELKGQESEIAAQIKNNEKTRVKLNQSLQTLIRREREEAIKQEQQRIAKQQEEDRKKKLADQQEQQKNPSTQQSNTANNVVTPPKKDDVTTGVAAPKTGNRSYSAFESTPEGLKVSLNFENNKLRLPWPVSTGIVTIHFGPYQLTDHLKGVSDGIYISLPVGTTVKSVADGTVSTVFDLGGANAVLVRHGKYFTVYNNLSSVSVNKGDQVTAGTVLGKAAAGDNGEGQLLFMVTNDKGDKLDPERWLKPR